MRKILHVDMNSFFASCEQANNPKLKEVPLIVGGNPKKRRGIVLAATYDVKGRGVKTAMPIYQAMKLCPEATVVEPTHGLYTAYSKKVMEIFDDFTPKKEQLSIDEAFLDMTGCDHLFGGIDHAAKLIQERIYEELDLGCSVGISSNKLLAKMASDFKKPMGITSIYPEDVEKYLYPLPVDELYGVGKRTVPKLNKMGIRKIGDLALADRSKLATIIGNKMSESLINRAQGIDHREVITSEYDSIKSVGNEITLTHDLIKKEVICSRLLVIAESVGHRLRRKGLTGRTVSLKLKYNDFAVITRSKTLKISTDLTDEIFETAKELLYAENLKKPIRLLGITVSNMGDEVGQISLFDEASQPQLKEKKRVKKEKVDQLTDQLREKFGYASIKRASTIGEIERVKK